MENQKETDLKVWVKKGVEKLRSFGLKEWGMLFAAGVCCLIIVFPSEGQEGGQKKAEHSGGGYVQSGENSRSGVEEEDYVTVMENRLSELLSSVEQVGNVKVMVTVNSTVKKTVLQDGSRESEQTIETDSAGGSRNSISERREGTTVFCDIENGSRPYILNETYPEITGVVVIAEGSGTGTVDLDILNAVQVLFDVPAHKISIMKMK